jgi:isochorismate pyruvate lyase
MPAPIRGVPATRSPGKGIGMKEPKDCRNIQDIRDAVNALDHEIIKILGNRTRYVHEAVRFKKSEEDIRRPGHIPALLEKRREWARENGVDPDFVERVYKLLTDHSFDVQAELFNKRK